MANLFDSILTIPLKSLKIHFFVHVIDCKVKIFLLPYSGHMGIKPEGRKLRNPHSKEKCLALRTRRCPRILRSGDQISSANSIPVDHSSPSKVYGLYFIDSKTHNLFIF